MSVKRFACGLKQTFRFNCKFVVYSISKLLIVTLWLLL